MSAQEKKLRVGSPLMHRRIAATPDAGDAPPWDLDTRHALVGKRIPRLDALAKVSGRARFPSDVRPGDLLYAAVLRSAIPAGMVKRIELGPALRMPGVEGGVLAKEPGKKIRYQGDELCAVCATSRAAAEEALRKVTLELEPSEHTAERAGEARQKLPEADPLPTSLAEVGEAEGDEVELTHVYETQTQMHHPLEPHGITARVGADSSVDVWASTQATFGMRAGIAKALEIPQEKVRVHTEHMGGGFGSKLSPGVEARLCALLAKQTGKPVQLFVDRRAEALAVGNRPASLQCLKVKASKAGKILEWSGKTIGLTGYAGSGRVTSPVSFYLPGKRARLGHEDLRDNQGSARAFRAPGHPQGFFAAESIVDELAYRVGMDPLEFRLKNLAGTLYTEQLKLAAKEIDWERHSNRSPGRVSGGERSLRGVGMAITTWGIWASRGTQVLCRIHPSGRVEVRNGAQDIGTGSRTVLGIITAETLGIPVERVDVFLGDTKDPVGPGSGGSMTAASLSPPARHAAWQAGKELLARIAEQAGRKVEDLKLTGGEVRIAGGRKLSWDRACAALGNDPVEALGKSLGRWKGFATRVSGCQLADVSVDLDTGHVRPNRIVAVQDCGTVVDMLTAESQVIGGVIQGIGYALFEERTTDPKLGRVMNTDLEQYRIPGSMEMPEIVPVLLRGNNGHNNSGVAGLGEPPTIPTAGAIANAVRNATGVRMHRLPMTPARVLEGLERMKIGRRS